MESTEPTEPTNMTHKTRFQILIQSKVILEIEYPENFKILLDKLNVFQFDFLKVFSVQCYANLDLLEEYLLLLASVPIVLALIFFIAKALPSRVATKLSTQSEDDLETSNPVFEASSQRAGGSGKTQSSNEVQSDLDQKFYARDGMFIFLFLIYPTLSMLDEGNRVIFAAISFIRYFE